MAQVTSGDWNCYDGALMDRFRGIIKQELINHRHYRTRRETIGEITECIEMFGNRRRLQTNLRFL